MDAGRVRDHLATDEGLRQVEEDIRQAQRLGIRAVPTFIFDGKYAVEGGQPAPVFLQALEEVARLARSGEGDSPAGDGEDACTDGACRV
jgi:predicted DsbA family dithiol-disulfide isomerase